CIYTYKYVALLLTAQRGLMILLPGLRDALGFHVFCFAPHTAPVPGPGPNPRQVCSCVASRASFTHPFLRGPIEGSRLILPSCNECSVHATPVARQCTRRRGCAWAAWQPAALRTIAAA